MFASTNELRGTSYKSRIEDPKYQFAGKTGTAQVKRISKRERELDLKTSQIPYEERDHALYVAFVPNKFRCSWHINSVNILVANRRRSRC